LHRGHARANLLTKLAVIEPKAHVDFMLWGGVSGNALEDPDWRQNLEDIAQEGVGSIKVYMLSGMDTFRDETARLAIPVGVHAEDRDMVHATTARLREECHTGPLDYAASRPPEAEISAVRTMCELAIETGARVHIVHLASGHALDLVTEFRRNGAAVSAETCPQYLAFTATDLETQGSLLKTAPVVKSAADRQRLWEGLTAGELAYIATDHAAGVWPDEKNTGSIWTDYGGVPLVELSLPYLYSEGVRAGRITLERLTEITASEPARFFGVEQRKGRIAPGFDADLVVLNADETWTVRAVNLHNLNRYSPFEGHSFTGRVQATYVRGEPVFVRRDDGSEMFGAAGFGRRVRRETPVS